MVNHYIAIAGHYHDALATAKISGPLYWRMQECCQRIFQFGQLGSYIIYD